MPSRTKCARSTTSRHLSSQASIRKEAGDKDKNDSGAHVGNAALAVAEEEKTAAKARG